MVLSFAMEFEVCVCVCVVVDGVVLWFGFFKGCVVKKERKKNYSN